MNGINKNAMLVATTFVGLFVVLDLALTWTNCASLIALSGSYAAAADEAQRAIFVAAANYPAAIMDSNILFVYNSFTLAAGILMTGLVMQKGIFSRSTAYLGVLTGILGIVSVASSFFTGSLSSATIIIASFLTTVWVFFVGYKLYRLGQSR